jgi:ABC-2 type transport system ATP-binding protein
MIRVENVTKDFGEIRAVDSVSFEVGAGEIMGLLGPNGAGKTTIMRVITGYMPPTEGRVIIDGLDMFDHPASIKRRIGYLPEHPPLYLEMTVREYLTFAGRIRGLGGSVLEERIGHVAELCGIKEMLGRLTGNLSKGYRQRTGLAQALVHDPDILVLDEPTVGLDPRQIIEIRDLIRELGRERTVILSTHILQEVTYICRKLAILRTGELVAFDTLEALSEQLSIGQLLNIRVARPENVDVDAISALAHVTGVSALVDGGFEVSVEAGHDMRERISAVLVGMDAGLLEIRHGALTLEEIFLKVIST